MSINKKELDFNNIRLNGKTLYDVYTNNNNDLIVKLEKELEILAGKFSSLRYGKNKEILFGEISSCFRTIAKDLRDF